QSMMPPAEEAADMIEEAFSSAVVSPAPSPSKHQNDFESWGGRGDSESTMMPPAEKATGTIEEAAAVVSPAKEPLLSTMVDRSQAVELYQRSGDSNAHGEDRGEFTSERTVIMHRYSGFMDVRRKSEPTVMLSLPPAEEAAGAIGEADSSLVEPPLNYAPCSSQMIQHPKVVELSQGEGYPNSPREEVSSQRGKPKQSREQMIESLGLALSDSNEEEDESDEMGSDEEEEDTYPPSTPSKAIPPSMLIENPYASVTKKLASLSTQSVIDDQSEVPSGSSEVVPVSRASSQAPSLIDAMMDSIGSRLPEEPEPKKTMQEEVPSEMKTLRMEQADERETLGEKMEERREEGREGARKQRRGGTLRRAARSWGSSSDEEEEEEEDTVDGEVVRTPPIGTRTRSSDPNRVQGADTEAKQDVSAEPVSKTPAKTPSKTPSKRATKNPVKAKAPAKPPTKSPAKLPTTTVTRTRPERAAKTAALAKTPSKSDPKTPRKKAPPKSPAKPPPKTPSKSEPKTPSKR
ncbi:hypothetical protein PMAYCL1PPCAC_31582, partial [Pristionchus mayeri]